MDEKQQKLGDKLRLILRALPLVFQITIGILFLALAVFVSLLTLLFGGPSSSNIGSIISGVLPPLLLIIGGRRWIAGEPKGKLFSVLGWSLIIVVQLYAVYLDNYFYSPNFTAHGEIVYQIFGNPILDSRRFIIK